MPRGGEPPLPEALPPEPLKRAVLAESWGDEELVPRRRRAAGQLLVRLQFRSATEVALSWSGSAKATSWPEARM